MTVTFKYSTDAGAPTLTGAAGSLIGVLDYCLVTTMGWTKEFSGTNLASYRAPNGNRHFLGVDDSNTLYTRLRGFETMTAAGVTTTFGTGPFPTDAQYSNGYRQYKSNDTTTARPWKFASDGKMFYLATCPSGPLSGSFFNFGEFVSDVVGDAYNTTIGGGTYDTDTSSQHQVCSYPSYVTSYGYQHNARDFTQISASPRAGKVITGFTTGSAGTLGNFSNGIAFPCEINGKIYIQPVLLAEPKGPRGRFPGLWCPMHALAFNDKDTFTGSGDLAGRSFVAWSYPNSSWQVLIETTDTWRT